MAHRSIHSISLIIILLVSNGILSGCRDDRRTMQGIGMSATVDTLVVPDVVTWTIKIQDEDGQLPAAKAGVDAKLAAVLEAISDLRPDPGSVDRGQVSIRRQVERCIDGQTRVTRYHVQRQVTFRQGDPSAIDGVLDRLIQAADLEVGCRFEVSDRETIMRRLRAEAMVRAAGRAAALLEPAGLSLGEVTGIQVNEDFDGRDEKRSRFRPGDMVGPEAKFLTTTVRVHYSVQ